MTAGVDRVDRMLDLAERFLELVSGDVDVKRSEDHEDREHDEHGHDNDPRSGVTPITHGVTVPDPFVPYSMDRRDLVAIRSMLVRLQRLVPRETAEWRSVGDTIDRLPN